MILLKKTTPVFIILLLVSLLGFSQENKVDFKNAIVPNSIYLTKSDASLINKNEQQIKVSSANLLFLEVTNIEEGLYTIPLQKNGITSKFNLETYQSIYNKLNLEKAFFKVENLYLPRTNPKKNNL